MSKSCNDGTGCVVWIALAAISIGVGCLWGSGMGWLTFGGILIAIILVAA